MTRRVSRSPPGTRDSSLKNRKRIMRAMGESALPIEASARIRSRIAFVAGCVLVAVAIAGALRGGPDGGVALAARLAWALALFTASRLLLRGTRPWTEALVTGCFLVSVGALTVLSFSSGAPQSARAFLVTAPLVFAILVPDAVRGIAVASAVTVIAATASQLAHGAGAGDAAMEAMRALGAGVVAVLGAVSAVRTRRAEVALAAERARALEALERSERRQAEVEKLAAAGSRAAGVAHDMSNPLASMRCNLDWLREAAAEGRLEAEGPETAQVIDETRECLDRLGKTLQEFRSVARTARALAVKVDELADAGSPVRAVPPTRASGE